MLFLKKRGPSQPSATNGRAHPKAVVPEAPEVGLPVLPNELIPSVLTWLDGRSLYHVALVSRRFNEISTRTWLARHGITLSQLSTGSVVIKSNFPAEAFAALRSALFVRARPLTGLKCILPPDSALNPTALYKLDAFISGFSPPLEIIDLDFRVDLIAQAEAAKRIARALAKLVSTLPNDCLAAVYVIKDGLFTCRPGALRRWSPETGRYERGWSESTLSSITMHDGSRQRVPTIRSMETLSIKYPVHAHLPPFNKWKIVTVDAASITELQLSIKLSSQEWSAILAAISLPSLSCVGLWAETITTEASTCFFNRHPIRIIKYMSPRVDPLPPDCPPLHLPRLEYLNTVAPYLVHILEDGDSSLLPKLRHIELRQHALFRDALVLACTLVPLRALTIWTLREFDAQWWPVFPRVRKITLNEIRVPASFAHLPSLLARAFPELVEVEVNYSFVSESHRQTAAEQAEFVKRVWSANAAVHTFTFDGQHHPI
ncbi:hypothetical protein C8J57DRAFT_1273894 [Mycena rebaudengoi]|nr:hypothetical protein C8J57DRAFT_1273894 [Mycena rebaudengoi]